MTIVISQGRNSFVLKSKYVSSGRLLSSEEEAVGYVRNVFSNTGCKTIILSCSDAVTCILDKHYDEMKADFFFFNAGEQGRLNKLTNKYEMQKLAVESGLNVPY